MEKTLCERCNRPLDGWTCEIYNEDRSVKETFCHVCDLVEYMDYYKKDGILTNKLIMQAVMAKSTFERNDFNRMRPEIAEFERQNKRKLIEIAAANEEIATYVRPFEEKHWLAYLKESWNKFGDRGHICKLNGITVMMWGSAGRVLITAEQADSDVTMIFTDEESQVTPNGGLQSLHATKETAINILKDITKPKKLNFRPKKSVTLAGL